MARPRFFPFYRLFPFPFSHFESNFRRFFDGTSLFSAPNFNFSSLRPVPPHASGTFSRDLTHYFTRTPFLHSVKAFPIRASPFVTPSSTFISRSTPPPFLIPRPSPPSPTFSHIPPHFSISLPNKRTITRALRAYAYARTSPHVRRFSFIAFTSSPSPRNSLCTNALGVKENEKKPSQITQHPHNQHINTEHPISSAVNFI